GRPEPPRQLEAQKTLPPAISPTMPPRQAPPPPKAPQRPNSSQRPDAPPRKGPPQPPPRPKPQEFSPPTASPDVPFRSISMNVPPPQSPPAQETPPSSLLVRPPKAVPQGGFRGAMYRLTSGRVNFGPSQTQIRLAERDSRISRSLERPYSTVFLSFKGGIGKTSTAVGVGLALAQARGVPPIAIDADPDSGDLAERLLGEEEMLRVRPRSITDLVRDIPNVRTWTDLSGYITQVDRLHVVAGEQDPAVSDSLTAEGYKRVHNLVQNFFSVILTDCGTGVTHNAMSGILSKADSVVIATGYAFSGVKRAVSTIDWLSQHGYEKLAQEAIVVLTDKDNVSIRVQKDMVRTHLATHSRQVFVVPNDQAVADGDRINLERVQPRTREAWAEVAAALIDGYQ
ncbi:MinD/ParA family ATP-binding protein, partial [Arachnia propionica]|uniref:MinD/ParA family ATP-binding protein n=1 Tax=Arachnia propionica TaxID=1750 RepID=UPI003C6F7F22